MITNYGHIYNGSFSGGLHNEDGGIINGGNFDCEVILESGSLIKNDGHIGVDDNFELTINGGAVECTSHLGIATCISDGICLVCNEKFADKDPNAHSAETEATCIALAVCKYCGEEIGVLADHDYNDGGDCIVEGCGVRAIVKIGDKFYLDFNEAMANAEIGETVYALINFEVASMLIPEGVSFEGGNCIVTVTEGDLTVGGTVLSGTFVLNEDRVIGVEPEGSIIFGRFCNDVNNSGVIRGGIFIDCKINNNGYIYNDNSVELSGSAKVENIGGTVDCYTHVGGVATCSLYSHCDVCGNTYGDLDPDYHVNVIADDAVESTCEKTGLTEGSHCEDCGKILEAQTEIAATGHKYDNDCDASCNACAEARTPAEHLDKDKNYTCDECGAELSKPGLSGGAIAGITVGSTAVVGFGGFSLFWFVIKKKKWSDLIGIFKK